MRRRTVPVPVPGVISAACLLMMLFVLVLATFIVLSCARTHYPTASFEPLCSATLVAVFPSGLLAFDAIARMRVLSQLERITLAFGPICGLYVSLLVYAWWGPYSVAAWTAALQYVAVAFAGFATAFLIAAAMNHVLETVTSGRSRGMLPNHRCGPFPLDSIVTVHCQSGSFGNGFVFRHDGYILTANHVVEGEPEPFIELANGEAHPGKVVARDPEHDIAMVSVRPGYGLPVASLGGSIDVRLGDRVVVVGMEPVPDRWVFLPRVGAKEMIRIALEPYVVPVSVCAALPSRTDGGSVFSVTGSSVPRPGYSGCPVCDSRTGAVIGMVCWGTAQRDVASCVTAESARHLLHQWRVRVSRWRVLRYSLPQADYPDPALERADAIRFVEEFRSRGGFADGEEMANWPDLAMLAEQLGKAIEAAPDYAAARVARAYVHLAGDDVLGAETDAREALRIAPGDPVLPREVLQQVFYRTERHEEALANARELMAHCEAIAPAKASMNRVLGTLWCVASFIRLNRGEEAVQLADVERDRVETAHRPALDQLTYLEGQAYAQLCQWPNAAACFRKAVAADHRLAESLPRLVEALVQAGDEHSLREAVEVGLCRLPSLTEEPVRLHGWIADACDRLGLPALATQSREREILSAHDPHRRDPTRGDAPAPRHAETTA